MNIKLLLNTIGILLSFNLYAHGYFPSLTSQDQPWSITASFGSGKYQHVYKKDGDTAVGRLALGNELLLTGDYALGLELGLQSGNHMRLNVPNESRTLILWLPVRTNLGPMLDLLITAKSDPIGRSDFFAQFKGGLMYRNWEIKQPQLHDLSQLAGEIQAGFGYPITALASLNLLYQGVYGNDPNVRIHNNNKTVYVSNIPTLHSILLGLSVNL